MRLTALVALVAFAAACGNEAPIIAPSAAKPSSRPTPESAAPSAGCLTVAPALLESIEKQAHKGSGMKMTGKGAAVRSPDHKEVYLVAAEFNATGVPAQIGVWATNRIDGSGQLILSADGFAKSFTNWPDASKTDAAITGGERYVLDAKACLKS